MSNGNFEYFEDMKEYAFDTSRASNLSKGIGGLTILFLVSGVCNVDANESYAYEVSSDKYELTVNNQADAECVVNTLASWKIENIKDQSETGEDNYNNLKKILLANGWLNMDATQRKEVDILLKGISILPIEESFIEYDRRSKTVFTVLSLPQDLRVSFTRYLIEDGDKDLYFSVKGENVLLYSGALPADEFVKATLEAIAEIDRQA